MNNHDGSNGHVPRHRAAGPATRMLRKVRWLRVTHPRQATPEFQGFWPVIGLDETLEPGVTARAATPTIG